jgi:HPt (histidine-containing phosphotransfer) domain-containing protein
MDDFLSKPLSLEKLCEMLLRFGLAAQDITELDAAAVQALVETPTESLPVDFPALQGLFGDDAGFAAEIVQAFVESSEQTLIEMRAALTVEDRSVIARAAHRLKGASANLRLDAAFALSSSLEAQADDTDWPTLHREIERLTRTVAHTNAELQRWLTETLRVA